MRYIKKSLPDRLQEIIDAQGLTGKVKITAQEEEILSIDVQGTLTAAQQTAVEAIIGKLKQVTQ